MTLIEKIWFANHSAGYFLWPILKPLSGLFSLISKKRRQAYIDGTKLSYKASVPVVVVGNISVGGNGKTPVVLMLVELLQSMNYKVGVVARGYGGKSSHYPLVVTSDIAAKQCGDEPKLIAQRTFATVVVDPNRSEAVKKALELGVDIIVTDDGLQHYSLQRDIEIAVIDGERRFGNGHMMPLGPLREPISRLEEVDFIITNGGEAQSGEMAMCLTPSVAVNLITGQKKAVSQLGELVAMAGIGHPPRFFATLEMLQANLVKCVPLADHKNIQLTEVETFVSREQTLIMTEKDAVKCQAFAQANWWYLPVDACLAEQDKAHITTKLKKVLSVYGS